MILLAGAPARANWTASGVCQYVDRAVDRRGFTGATPRLPIRNATVQVLDAGTGDTLARGGTDGSGRFVIPVPDSAVRDISIRVVASTFDTTLHQITAITLDALGSTYVLPGPLVRGHPPSADVALGAEHPILAMPDSLGQVFNILDCLENGLDYLSAVTGGGRPRRRLYAHWHSDFFGASAGDDGVYLGGNDGYNDCVILHEEGHFVETSYMALASTNSPRRGPCRAARPEHFVTEYHQGLEEAWWEGWPSYFALATRRWMGAVDATCFIEVQTMDAPPGLVFAYDVDGVQIPVRGAGSEYNVQKVLWDLTSLPAPGRSGPGAGAGRPGTLDSLLWHLLSHELSTPNWSLTLEQFVDGWMASGYGRTAELSSILLRRDIEFFADAQENDSWASRARPVEVDGPPAHHTFYPKADADWIRFEGEAGRSYLVEATDLVGMPEPVLDVFAPDTTARPPVGDEMTVGDSVSARPFEARASGTCYVRCTHGSNGGSYGSYDLRVVSCGATPDYQILRSLEPRGAATGPLIAAGNGLFYGLEQGGDTASVARVISLDSLGNRNVVRNFSWREGVPTCLIWSRSGSLLGTIASSDLGPRGVVFRLDPSGALTVVRAFARSDSLRTPTGQLVEASSGLLYGESSDSVLFSLSPGGVLTKLHRLTYADGGAASSLAAGADGALYGVTGLQYWHDPRVFRLRPSGEFQLLATFPRVGEEPALMSTPTADGALLGTAWLGGQASIFALDTLGNVTVRHSFSPWQYAVPSVVLQASDGRLYGIGSYRSSSGWVFSIDSVGSEAQLHLFPDLWPTVQSAADADGTDPTSLVDGHDGGLYGLTRGGGAAGAGVFFRVAHVLGAAWVAAGRPRLRPGTGYVDVSWTGFSLSAQQYRVWRSGGGSGAWVPVSGEIRGVYLGDFCVRDTTARPFSSYSYKLASRVQAGEAWTYSEPAGVRTGGPLALGVPFPNPSRGTVRLAFHAVPGAAVRIEVFDIRGARVRTLLDGKPQDYEGSVLWDGTDRAGRRVRSGVYFARLLSSGQSQSAKLVLLR